MGSELDELNNKLKKAFELYKNVSELAKTISISIHPDTTNDIMICIGALQIKIMILQEQK